MTALIRPRKGIEVALRALAILRGQGLRSASAWSVPSRVPTTSEEVKELTRRLGLEEAVDWVGFTRDVDRELGQMDLFVLPSLFGEGTPLVLFEAMAAGVPVVSTRVEGIPEIIRHGRDGLLVEPGDSEALAAALAKIASRPGRLALAPPERLGPPRGKILRHRHGGRHRRGVSPRSGGQLDTGCPLIMLDLRCGVGHSL